MVDQVFFSGCLHGNERVGPSAVLEAAILMVTAAVCHTDASVVVSRQAEGVSRTAAGALTLDRVSFVHPYTCSSMISCSINGSGSFGRP